MSEEPKKKTFLEKLSSVKAWIIAIPVVGLGLWWIIKILICMFTGVCLL